MRIQAVQAKVILADHFSPAADFSKCHPEIFRQRINTLRAEDSRYALGLDPKDNYHLYDCWIDPQGHSGFAVGRDHELTNVFSCGSIPGLGGEAVKFAQERYGSLHLNCFAGAVERFYMRHGFVETVRERHWEGANHPDVVFMRYDR